MKKPKQQRTLHDFVAELGDRNITVSQWAESHGFDRQDVYMLLRGATHGRRGKSRRVLEAMGVQPPPLIKVRAKPQATA